MERDNSAFGRNRFTGHPRCGEFDNWVSNNSVLLLARKDVDSLPSYLKQENVKWLVILCYVNIPATSVFKKTYSSGSNYFSTLKCFLHFIVGFFSLCCLQRYLKHYMHKVSLEFHSCSSFLSSSSSFFYSHKQRRLNKWFLFWIFWC